MSENTSPGNAAKNTAWFIGAVGTFLLVAGLVVVMGNYTRPALLGAGRDAERERNLSELQLQTAKLINEYAWQDQPKEIVRLKVDRAMELTLKQWQDPAKARAELIARMEKATAVPPQPAEPANPYE